MARNSRDDLLKAFVASNKKRRKTPGGFGYQPAKQGALPPMENAFKAQSSTPRVKRGRRYRPAKRNQGIARY